MDESEAWSKSDHTFDSLVMTLHDIGAIKFGDFQLKSGFMSPIYFDLRIVISYPGLLKSIGIEICKNVTDKKLIFDVICGIPYTALPVATVVSAISGIPMILKRKEPKSYGTKKMIEGNYEKNHRCLLVEDVVTTGSSVVETATVLRAHDLIVTDVICILDRGQGAKQNLAHHGINLHSLLTVPMLLGVLQHEKILSAEKHAEISVFLDQNLTSADLLMGDKLRSLIPSIVDPRGKKLIEIMIKKKSNLSISFDLDSWWEVLEAVERLAGFICVAKLHLDTYNFENCEQVEEFRRKMLELSDLHEFLILEDRKYSDIGNTVQKQLKSKPFEVGKWVHMVTAHGIAGPGMLKAISTQKPSISLILIAEMSSEGNLAAKGTYTKEVVALASGFESHIIGFVAQSKIPPTNSWFLQFTPGVSLSSGADQLGQQYATVEEAVEVRGADVIIVGRGILGKDKNEQTAAAMEYQSRAWRAWTKRMLRS